MNGISALIKEAPESSSPILPCEDIVKRPPGSHKALGLAGALILDFQSPQL